MGWDHTLRTLMSAWCSSWKFVCSAQIRATSRCTVNSIQYSLRKVHEFYSSQNIEYWDMCVMNFCCSVTNDKTKITETSLVTSWKEIKTGFREAKLSTASVAWKTSQKTDRLLRVASHVDHGLQQTRARGWGHCSLLEKSKSVFALRKLHLRSQFERPRRCFSVKKDREWCSIPTISFLCTIKSCVVVLVFWRRTRGRRTRHPDLR